jgi:hypothetical protein
VGQDIQREMITLRTRIAHARSQRTAAGDLQARLVRLMLRQLRKEIAADRRKQKPA